MKKNEKNYAIIYFIDVFKYVLPMDYKHSSEYTSS